MKTNRLTVLSALLLVAVLVAMPLTVAAQDPTQTFTTTDGSFSFDYPADWIVEDFVGMVFAASSQAALDAFFESSGYTAEQVIVVVQTPVALAEDLGGFDGMDEVAVLTKYLEDVDVEGDVRPDTIGGKPVAVVRLDEAGEAAVVYVVNLGDGGFAAVVQFTAAGQAATFEPITHTVIETMTAGELSFTMPVIPEGTPSTDPMDGAANVAVTGGTVIWQQLLPVDATATTGFNYAGKLVVGPDDMIYVLDLRVGVHRFDDAGTHLGVIVPDDMFMNLHSFDVSADNALWGVDQRGTMIQFDLTGATLHSIPLPETMEVAIMGVDLEIGPDGNLYLLNPHDADDGSAIGEVVVFSPTGELLTRFDIGTDPYFYEASMTFGPDGLLYVAERYGEHGIKVFNPNGDLVHEDVGVADLYTIAALAVGGDGAIVASLSGSPIFYY
ncbi:MAG: hypothetical protein K8S97_05360, partial [Anaerolineae bacterium]|nr:hypothetical protein [Anaerolineae bacterium]